ncbi:KdsC family phosphatase [Streptomyces kaniharaensis]|uniref:KdsC family phosphatase n=1 Tax=Streptomyces kaniharaensis TaxID=212423 RepID=UPI0018A852A6|nr:hypothetical protein [Streptomyces kaniharaensis]
MDPVAARDNLERLPIGLCDEFAHIELVCLDVDGILTDGSIIYSESGRALVTFNARDGLGIALLQRAGVSVAFVSALDSPIVRKRAEELHIKSVCLGVNDKLRCVRDMQRHTRGKILFMGDDLWDLAAMRACDVAASSCDAAVEALAAADVISSYGGGRGAVRQIADMTLEAQDIDRGSLMARYDE